MKLFEEHHIDEKFKKFEVQQKEKTEKELESLDISKYSVKSLLVLNTFFNLSLVQIFNCMNISLQSVSKR